MDINFAKYSTINSVIESINENLSKTARIDISNVVYDTANSSVSYYLQKGMKIICDKTILSPLASNLEEITDGYLVIASGVVRLQSTSPISENNKPLLSILS